MANKFAKFHAKKLNRSENIPKSFRGLLFFETPCIYKYNDLILINAFMENILLTTHFMHAFHLI